MKYYNADQIMHEKRLVVFVFHGFCRVLMSDETRKYLQKVLVRLRH